MIYFVGIDIAKFKHDCFICDETGNTVKDSFSFTNDLVGFSTLLSILNSLKDKGEIKIGFESTGHYHFNLMLFLENNNYTYVTFNPLLVHNFIRNTTLRKTKTDKKDAKQIAKYLMTVDYKPIANKLYHTINLKSLTRLRENLITSRTKYINQLIAYLDQIFPEFKAIFKDGLNNSALYLLKHYLTPKKIAKLNLDDYNKMKSILKHPISYQKFCLIIDKAKVSIGNTSEALEICFKITLNTYVYLTKKIDNLENKIIETYNKLYSHIHTIRGIGIITAAGILAEITDVNRFKSAGQLLAFAGLEASQKQTGEMDKTGKMIKHGSSYLRKYLTNFAETLYVHNPKISDCYWKKRKEGKCHRVALNHVSRKLINIIFVLESNHIDFNSNKV